MLLSVGGASNDALALLDAAAGEPSFSPDERARLLGDASVAALVTGNGAHAADLVGRALALGAELTDRSSLVDAYCVRSWLESFELRFDDAARSADLAVGSMGEEAAARARSAPEFFAGMVLMDAGRLADAEAMFSAGRERADVAGAAWQLVLYHFGLGAVGWQRGTWRDAVTEIDTGLVLARDLGSALGSGFGRTVLALMAIARDDLREARSHLDAAAADFAAGSDPVGLDWYALAGARCAEADGDAAAALARVGEIVELDLALGMLNDLGDVAPDLVRLGLASGQERYVADVVERIKDAAGHRAHPALSSALLRCDALVANDAGVAAAAVEQARASATPLALADGLAEAAVIAAATGSTVLDAVATMEEALARYDELGAVRPATRALAAARAAGLRTRRFATRTRPRTGWDALSPTERDVVRLVAEGLTNPAIGARLFISRRTAETHVRHTLVKVGVASRVELAAAYRARSD